MQVNHEPNEPLRQGMQDKPLMRVSEEASNLARRSMRERSLDALGEQAVEAGYSMTEMLVTAAGLSSTMSQQEINKYRQGVPDKYLIEHNKNAQRQAHRERLMGTCVGIHINYVGKYKQQILRIGDEDKAIAKALLTDVDQLVKERRNGLIIVHVAGGVNTKGQTNKLSRELKRLRIESKHAQGVVIYMDKSNISSDDVRSMLG